MFREAWRLERDYFYDPKMHGVDWPAMLEKYRPLSLRVTSRGELDDLLGQMVSELSALHTFVYGGEHRKGGERSRSPRSAPRWRATRRRAAGGSSTSTARTPTCPPRPGRCARRGCGSRRGT